MLSGFSGNRYFFTLNWRPKKRTFIYGMFPVNDILHRNAFIDVQVNLEVKNVIYYHLIMGQIEEMESVVEGLILHATSVEN